MKTRTILLASLSLLTVAGASGCADNRASIQVQHICFPSQDCTFTATCDQYIGYPTIDSLAGDRLWLFFQVANQNVVTSNAPNGRANTANAHVDEAHVEYDGVALPPTDIGSNFSVPANGTAVISAEVIPRWLNASATLAALAPTPTPTEIVARVRLRGYFDDGTRFETGEFPIAIRVCSGCVGAALCSTCPPDSPGQLPAVCTQ